MAFYEVTVIEKPSKKLADEGAESAIATSEKVEAPNPETAAFKVGAMKALPPLREGYRREVSVRPL